MHTNRQTDIYICIIFSKFSSMSNRVSKLYRKPLKEPSLGEALQSCRDGAGKQYQLNSLKISNFSEYEFENMIIIVNLCIFEK